MVKLRVTREWTVRTVCAVVALAIVGCSVDPEVDEEPADPAPDAPGATDLPRQPFVPMEAIVKFRTSTEGVAFAGPHRVAGLEALPGGTSLVRFDTQAGIAATDPTITTWALIEELRSRDDVEYAHPNWLFQLSLTPNDPHYPNQWHYPAIQLPAAWDLTTGSSAIRIAILDTGRTTHPDQSGKWVPAVEYDAVAEDGNALTDATTTWRHGSHVASIAGGASNNSQSSAGVCWNCQLLNVKVALGNSVSTTAVIRGIHWAVENGARVINMSFETNGLACSHANMTGMRDAVAFATARNVTVVAAAGNKGANAANTVPASCAGAIAVAATDRNNVLAQYSNRGAVTLAAPGGAATLVSGPNGPQIGPDAYGAGVGCPADPASTFGTSIQGAFANWTTSNNGHCGRYLSGTSMAAPHVAGVVGLMLTRNPSLTPAQVRQILQSTAQPLPACGGNCGAGLLNALGAVQQAASWPANARPVPRIVVQCSGLDCTLDGRSSSDDHGIVAYQWILPGVPGAQQLRTGAVTSFFMPGYGSKTVRLRVTDTSGQAAEITQIVNPLQPSIAPVPGAYYNPQRSGNGIDLFQNSLGDWTVTWYTYQPGGTPIWYISGAGPRTGARWSQPLYQTTWNGSSASTVQVGTISLDFSNSTSAWFSWTLNGMAGGERFVYLAGGQGRSGAWYVPTQSGWGIQVQESGTVLSATVGFYDNGQPRWMTGSTVPGSNVTIPLSYYRGGGLCPSCGGSTPPVVDTHWQASSMNLQILNGSSTTGLASTSIKYDAYLPKWVRPLQTIQLLTQP